MVNILDIRLLKDAYEVVWDLRRIPKKSKSPSFALEVLRL